MSTSSPPASHSMRQQLDELDALLQRMLTLPINQTDDGAADPAPAMNRSAEAPSAVGPPLAPIRRPQMMLLDGSAPVRPPQTPPANWDPHWNINLNPQQGSSILGPRSPAAQPPQPQTAPPVWRAETVAYAPSQPEPTPQPPLSTPVAQFEARPAPRAQPQVEDPTPIPLAPLVGLNRAFDAVMICFGPPGQWFCTTAGRNLLGYAGLALLLGSAAWTATGWFGWPR
jgi:hypothetical protein